MRRIKQRWTVKTFNHEKCYWPDWPQQEASKYLVLQFPERCFPGNVRRNKFTASTGTRPASSLNRECMAFKEWSPLRKCTFLLERWTSLCLSPRGLSYYWIRKCRKSSPWCAHTLSLHQSARVHRPQPRNDACHHRRLERRKSADDLPSHFVLSSVSRGEKQNNTASRNVVLPNEIIYLF